MSSAKDAAAARQHAENADDFAWLTTEGEGRRQNSRQRKYGTGSMKSGKPSTSSVKKYGKWAKEEAKSAHKARSSALKKHRDYKAPSSHSRKK